MGERGPVGALILFVRQSKSNRQAGKKVAGCKTSVLRWLRRVVEGLIVGLLECGALRQVKEHNGQAEDTMNGRRSSE
jgi:hypothetical protein